MSDDLNRRQFFALAAAPAILQVAGRRPGGRTAPTSTKLTICMHEASADKFDFRTAMEGWAKAGIKAVEPNLVKVREFAEKDSPQAARKLLDDLGLKAISSSNQLFLPEPGPQRARALEDLKWKVELAEVLGADRLVCPSAGPGMYTRADYAKGVDNLREAAEIAKPHGVTLMLEFARTSHFVGCLPTALKMVRDTNHPNVAVMMDTYHFWGGISKFEDLELLRDGELHHVHFEDVPADPPREIQGQPDRVYPGEGIAPLRRIVEVLKRKKYAGAVSFESFNPMVQSTDPYEVAKKYMAAVEPLIA
ncbi:MAG TPA: sugar phosphate isomerase/epimerase family protein [Vicinamibacterales bacterium]|nr:sugar phosphate isomerase/epimerase family protein [Vicinamibacterales bacterium]